MKRNSRRLLSVLILAAMIISLTACGTDTSGSSEEVQTSAGSGTVSQQPPQSMDKAESAPQETGPTPVEAKESIEDRANKALQTLEVWDGSVAESFDGGDGSAENPYQIANGAQLAKLANDVNSGVDFDSSCFILTSDILLNDIGEWDLEHIYVTGNQWMPIGLTNYFGGDLDGQGHTIWGLWAGNQPYSAGVNGLFGTVTGGNIANVDVSYCCLSAVAEYTGAIVGELRGGSVGNCHISKAIIAPECECRVGGICGMGSGATISGCSVQGKILCKGDYRLNQRLAYSFGGIAGICAVITDCYSDVDITIQAEVELTERLNFFEVGGICGGSSSGGSSNGVTNCYNTGNISVDVNGTVGDDYEHKPYLAIGGIIGTLDYDGSIVNCGNAGDITYAGNVIETQVGGIAGRLGRYMDDSREIEVNSCFTAGSLASEVASDDNWTGGLGGIAGGVRGHITITNCYYNKDCGSKAFATNYSNYTAPFTNQVGGLSDDQFHLESSYADWDFESVWYLDEHFNHGLPCPKSIMTYLNG